ncbi:MAG: diguanylate cyclase, partial [Pseudomonadota bacterium]
ALYSDEVGSHLLAQEAGDGTDRTNLNLPAVMILSLGEALQTENPDQSISLYSDYPFPDGEFGVAPFDSFQREALDQLASNPSEPFYRVETDPNESVFRYAEPIVMAASCVACHNNHILSPKRNWRVGDVAGVLEVAYVSDAMSDDWAMRISRRLFMVGLAFFLISVAAFLYLRSQRAKRTVEQQVRLRTAELSYQAHVDGLTEIANRRSFDERLEQAWSALHRGGGELSLLLGDIDFFKKFNDHYGHPAGDACLRQIALVFSECVKRPDDLVARYGGEEFGVILPGTDNAGALQIAEVIRASVKALDIPHESSSVAKCVTLSLGVATCEDSAGMTANDLLVLADTALYDAKMGGRDRCVARVGSSVTGADELD